MKAATTGNNMGVADQLGGASDSRGMTVKGDEMLFAYRATFTGIKIYDLKTGEKKRDVQFDTEKFKITYTYTKIDTIVNAPGDTTFQQTPMENKKKKNALDSHESRANRNPAATYPPGPCPAKYFQHWRA